jgi:hypothetical protein
VVEVDGERRRLRALPEAAPGTEERWVAAFPWEGDMPRLPGAELEVGRGIVVDLPRPRRSKARAAAAAAPLPATSRAERESAPGREEAERLLAVLAAARTEADEATARAGAAEARAEAAESELAAADVAALRARAEAAEAESETLRIRAQEADALRGRAEDAEVEAETLRARAEQAESELESLRGREEDAVDVPALRARAEAAEDQAAALRVQADEAETLRARAEELEAELATLRAAEPVAAPDLERLRTELGSAERERMELRAQLDTTAERLAAAEAQTRALRSRSGDREGAAARAAGASDRTTTMPGPRTAAARSETDDPPAEGRFGRRPAERTARRAPDADGEEPSAAPPLGERISDWVASLTGSRSEPQNGHAEAMAVKATPAAARIDRSRVPRTSEAGSAARTRRRSERRTPAERESPSWVLRAAAVGLLALLMVALVVIVLSLL